MGRRNKIRTGIILGAVAGAIDVIPMLVQGLSWDAKMSAFVLWIVSGFMISTSDLRMAGWLKGLLTSVLVLSPAAILIGANEPTSLVPIGIMTLLLGSGLGYAIEKLA